MFSSVSLDKNPPVDVRIDEMVQWGKRFHQSGFVHGVEGNLSFRTKLGFIITGNGIALNSITKDTAVEVRGVVFGLNKPSVYTKGKIEPSMEALLHAGIYEILPEINAIFYLHAQNVLKVAEKLGILSTCAEQPAGSQELAQEVVNLIKLNQNERYFVLRNHGVIVLGTTMSEAGKLAEEMQNKAESSVKVMPIKKKST